MNCKKTSLEEQLTNRANFLGKNGNLYLVRCVACGDRENWNPAVASGSCAWCGWSLK